MEEEEEEEEEAPAPAPAPAPKKGGCRRASVARATCRWCLAFDSLIRKSDACSVFRLLSTYRSHHIRPFHSLCHTLPAGFFTLGSRKAAPAPAVEEEEEEEEEAPAPAKRGAFAFGSRRGGAAVAEAEAEAPPATKRIIRGRNPVAAPEEPKPKARPAPVQQQKEEGGAPKKSGFLGFLGISSETVYADE